MSDGMKYGCGKKSCVSRGFSIDFYNEREG
jgi:hypothetical protein